MNTAVAFFAGCVSFVMMMVIKLPIKKLTRMLVEQLEYYEEKRYVLYKRFNGVIILLTIIVAAVCYYLISTILGVKHFKLCCSLKAGMIAIALYAAYEQWFGEE